MSSGRSGYAAFLSVRCHYYSNDDALFTPAERHTKLFDRGYVLERVQGVRRVTLSNAALGSRNQLIYFILIPVGNMVSVFKHFISRTVFKNKLSLKTKVPLYILSSD